MIRHVGPCRTRTRREWGQRVKQQSSLRLQEGFLEEVRMEPEKEGPNSQVLYLTFPVS